MLFGFGVLVYYMDRNFMVNSSQAMLNGQPNGPNGPNGHQAESVEHPAKARLVNTRVIKVKNSQEDDNAQRTPLPPYSTDELRTWSEPAMKDNPRDWPGICHLLSFLSSISLTKSVPCSPAGENGVAVVLDKDEEKDYKAKFDLNKFNLIASDKIALNRSLPDFRLDG